MNTSCDQAAISCMTSEAALESTIMRRSALFRVDMFSKQLSEALVVAAAFLLLDSKSRSSPTWPSMIISMQEVVHNISMHITFLD